MLESNLKVEKKENQGFAPLPEDVYQVELLDITSETKPTFDTKNKPDEQKEYETVLKFQFVLLNGVDGDKQLRERSLWANYVPTYLYISSKKGKNNLYRIVEALLGRELTPEDEAYMDGAFLNRLVGGQLRVGTINKKDGDEVYTNIDKYMRANQRETPLTPEEKEKAKVKPKDETIKSNTNPEIRNESDDLDYPADNIDPENIPF